MKQLKIFALLASILGALGVLFGAFGAHAVKGKISDYHYGSYRVGIEYLFFHLVPLFYISTREYTSTLNRIGYFFIIGIICFASSNLLMTTEAIHGINFHVLWPITPLGGIFLLIGWIYLAYYLVQSKNN